MKQHPYRPEIDTLEDRCLLSGDMVLRWNGVAQSAVRNDYNTGHPVDLGGPTMDSRALAIASIAIADATAAIDHSSKPYLPNIGAPAGASVAAAIAAAGHDSLAALYPHQQSLFDQAFQASLRTIAHNHASARSIRLGVMVGQVAAAQILAARASDGSKVLPSYTFGTLPGQWNVDPLHPSQMALGVDWGAVTPFAMPNVTQFNAPPVPPMNSAAYTAAFNEVKALGGDGIHTPTTRTAKQTMIGIFWGYDGSIGLGTPPVLYNEITQTIARQMHNGLAENARLFALVNVAMADTGVAVWNSKYNEDFWRPVTAIRAADTDGNPQTVADPTWTPLGAPNDNGGGTNFTPPFPAYPSGHAGFGGALFRTLADFYGTDHIGFTFESDEFNGHTRDQNGNVRPVVKRHFKSLSQAMEENGQSRIYLGIHWRFDKVDGIKMGKHVADFVFHHFLQEK
jgi:hypothetical protein